MGFKNINLKITSGLRIGFIGATGSGKSTCDIIMGLLMPTNGKIFINGMEVKQKIMASVYCSSSSEHLPLR